MTLTQKTTNTFFEIFVFPVLQISAWCELASTKPSQVTKLFINILQRLRGIFVLSTAVSFCLNFLKSERD